MKPAVKISHTKTQISIFLNTSAVKIFNSYYFDIEINEESRTIAIISPQHSSTKRSNDMRVMSNNVNSADWPKRILINKNQHLDLLPVMGPTICKAEFSPGYIIFEVPIAGMAPKASYHRNNKQEDEYSAKSILRSVIAQMNKLIKEVPDIEYYVRKEEGQIEKLGSKFSIIGRVVTIDEFE